MNRALISNGLWFLASLLLAFVVWLIATTEADPIQEWTIAQSIRIRVEPDEGLMLVSQTDETVRVTVRAPESVRGQLTSSDVTVWADLAGLGPGMHTVPLRSSSTRQAELDLRPRQLTVELEQELSQQVPVTAQVPEDRRPPAGYEQGDILFEQTQVLASGPISRVQNVVAARATLDLRDQRGTLEAEVRLIPVDAEGNEVEDVVLQPNTLSVTITISRRENTREVAIIPDIDRESLPEGYDLVSFSSSPQTILVYGTTEELESLPSTLLTQTISLEDRTADFDIQTSVVFPDTPLSILGEQTIKVSIEIEPTIVRTQFENVPVSVTGITDATWEIDLVPLNVSAFVTGPQVVLETLSSEEISVILDVSGLSPATYELTPSVSTGRSEILPTGIEIVPEQITVTIISPVEATQEVTSP